MDTTRINHNNSGHKYRIAVDIAKEGSHIWNLTPYVKGRVGDNNFGLQVTWYYQGQLMNVVGMKPYIEGLVGQYSFGKNGEIDMDPDAVPVRYDGSPDDCEEAGKATFYFPSQMFPKEGIFKGFIGVKDDRDGSKNPQISGVTIWFKVLPGIAQMGHACDAYVDELDKALQNFKDRLDQHDKDYQTQLQQVIDDARDAYNAETKNAHDALINVDAQIKANRDNMQNLADHLASTEQQIQDHDIVTIPNFNNKLADISDSINQRLAKMKMTPMPFDNSDALKAQYPNGADGVFLTQNDKHLWTFLDGRWQDLGAYQATQLDNETNCKINDSFNHVRKENLIPNGSFNNGVAPSLANAGGMKLFTNQYLNRTWLNVTSEVPGKYLGIHWDIKSQGEHFSYPIHLSWIWQTSQPSTFYVNILYLNAKGEQIGFQNVGKYWLNSWRFTDFDTYIRLDKNYSDCYTWQVQIYRDGEDAFPITLITDVSATLAYDNDQAYANNNQIQINKSNLSDVSNHVFKENLISNSSFSNLDGVSAKTADTQMFVNQYFGRNWLNFKSDGITPDKGVYWDVDFPQETAYPFKLSFDIHSTQNLTLKIALAYLDGNQQILKWQSIDNVSLQNYKFTHYQTLFKISNTPNAKTLRVFLFKMGTEVLPNIMLTDVTLRAEYNNDSDLRSDYFVEKNLILNGDFKNGVYPAYPMNANSNLTVGKYLDMNWLNFGADGVLWAFDLSQQNGEAYSYTYDLSFTIKFPQDTDLKVQQMFYDKDGKYLETDVIDRKRFKQWRFVDYHKRFRLHHVDGAVSWQLQLVPSGSGQLTNVCLYRIFDTADVNYSLPVVNLDGDISGMDKSTSKNMHFSMMKNGIETQGYAKVKWQGDSSLTFPKKGLRLKLYTTDNYDEKLKIQPKKSWQETSKFNLKAYPNDALLCHDVVNANIGSDIWGTNLKLPDQLFDETNLGFIDGFPIILFINNSCQGLYSFNLPRSDFDTTKYAIIGDQYTDATSFKKANAKLDESDFESLFPEKATDDEKTALNGLIEFVATSSDEDFEANLTKHVDLDSAIDYLIFSNIIGDGDAWGKNQVLLSYDGQIWYWHPYDLDGSYGLNWTGGLHIQEGTIWGTGHQLFSRLMKLFLPEIKTRYTQLRSWLTPTYIADKYVKYVDSIGTENYQLDWDIWNPKSQKENSIVTLRKNINNQFKILDQNWLISKDGKAISKSVQKDPTDKPKSDDSNKDATASDKPTTPQAQPSGTTPANTEPAKQATSKINPQPTTPQVQPTEPKQ